MATVNYSWNLPTVGGSEDTWGTSLNANWTDLDTLLGGVSQTEFAILDGATVSTAELNLLDGVTATTAELNILDGVTATATELNLLDGITALSGSDTEIVTGTAGTDGQIGKWNADGDLIGVGTNTANGDVVVLEDVSGSPGLPAVDGSQLTGISIPDWTVSSVTATTSGAAFDETNLPSGITELEIFLTDISGSGNQNMFVQLGTGGSPTTSGYISAATQFTAPFMYTSTARFEINHASAALALSAIIRIVKEPGTNTWVQAHTGILGGNNLTFGNGEVTLSGELDNFRLGVSAGAFDAGSFWYRYK